MLIKIHEIIEQLCPNAGCSIHKNPEPYMGEDNPLIVKHQKDVYYISPAHGCRSKFPTAKQIEDALSGKPAPVKRVKKAKKDGAS
jgi:hypothetical protein